MKYGRDSLFTYSVIVAIKCKELEFKIENKTSRSGETLFSKGKRNHFKKKKFIKGQRFHKQRPVFKCYHYQKGHIKKIVLTKRRKTRKTITNQGNMEK